MKDQSGAKGSIHAPLPAEVAFDNSEDGGDDDLNINSYYEELSEKKKKLILEQKNAEYKRLKEELLKSKRAVNVLTGKEADNVHILIKIFFI